MWLNKRKSCTCSNTRYYNNSENTKKKKENTQRTYGDNLPKLFLMSRMSQTHRKTNSCVSCIHTYIIPNILTVLYRINVDIANAHCQFSEKIYVPEAHTVQSMRLLRALLTGILFVRIQHSPPPLHHWVCVCVCMCHWRQIHF